MSDHEAHVRRLARVLSEISHTLESSDNRQRRVERSLALTRDIVPARRCVLLEMHDDVATLYVSPEEAPSARDALVKKMTGLYRLVSGGDEIGRSCDAVPSLALPVMGLDEIIGVLRIESSGESYDARHLRLLSVVAAQLGAYLAMVRLRERDAARTREIEAAHDFQRLFAGVVGHDLRNPLAVISMVASSLLEKAEDPRQVISLQRALRNAELATRLISDLVDVTESRVNGVIRIVPQAGDFADVIERSVEDLRQAHNGRMIELGIDGKRPLLGRFDPTRVSQIVANLVNNAAIHGDPSRPIRIRVCEQNAGVVIAVRNWGPPIPPTLLSTIFDPFKQGAPASRPQSARGLGLGLYIIDRLARGHGGSVTVASDAEAGTVFRVWLPREATAPALHAVSHTERPLVMVVDDDEAVRIGLTGILEKRGYEVATAADGLEALQQLHHGLRPKLIFLDYSMPVMNGEEFCQRCADDPELAAIPIVVVSSDTALAVRLAQNRSLSVLTKPVPVEKLLAAIHAVK